MQEEPRQWEQGSRTSHSMTPVSEESVPKSCRQMQQNSLESDFTLFSILRISARNCPDMVGFDGQLERVCVREDDRREFVS